MAFETSIAEFIATTMMATLDVSEYRSDSADGFLLHTPRRQRDNVVRVYGGAESDDVAGRLKPAPPGTGRRSRPTGSQDLGQNEGMTLSKNMRYRLGSKKRRDESRRGTQECVRHVFRRLWWPIPAMETDDKNRPSRSVQRSVPPRRGKASLTGDPYQ
ncbi:hypothetical protein SBA4_4340001 [Candidatus Sulfopaludibacter sp. SbA4]|nr:hypothetical protein SBA4_4340001 [Candidatus Sulfopaludibacter sp. SbA4]